MPFVRSCCLYGLWLLFVSSKLAPCGASVVAAAVLPHGAIALEPHNYGLNSTQEAQARELQAAALQAGRFLAAAQPDVVLLSTPHGIADLDRFSFLLNPRGAGCLEPGVTAHHLRASSKVQARGGAAAAASRPCANVSLDPQLSVQALKYLQDRTFKRTGGLSGFGPPGEADLPFPLGWGEVTPLLFLPDALRAAAQFLVLSHPTRRYTDAALMMPELLDMGGVLFDFLERAPQRVAVLVSADLAHTHDPDGPYGYSPDAAPFDEAIGKWAQTLQLEHLEAARSWVGGAKSCGFTGLALLHGILSRAAAQQPLAGSQPESSSGSSWGDANPKNGTAPDRYLSLPAQPKAHAGARSAWDTQLLVLHHPSYYGMAVATMQRRSVPHSAAAQVA